MPCYVVRGNCLRFVLCVVLIHSASFPVNTSSLYLCVVGVSCGSRTVGWGGGAEAIHASALQRPFKHPPIGSTSFGRVVVTGNPFLHFLQAQWWGNRLGVQ
uniref:Secreted protein n=1 Tax=Trypanosoma congolense (strain IL3000) TaxID=1068625 RepID=G0URQ5_TRYCI|nr:hypothetical protein, unlikely [Trypanosoma congolense IL3000]